MIRVRVEYKNYISKCMRGGITDDTPVSVGRRQCPRQCCRRFCFCGAYNIITNILCSSCCSQSDDTLSCSCCLYDSDDSDDSE